MTSSPWIMYMYQAPFRILAVPNSAVFCRNAVQSVMPSFLTQLPNLLLFNFDDYDYSV